MMSGTAVRRRRILQLIPMIEDLRIQRILERAADSRNLRAPVGTARSVASHGHVLRRRWKAMCDTAHRVMAATCAACCQSLVVMVVATLAGRSPPLRLIYSFGIKDQYEFENQAVGRGCTVHGYDPTVPQRTCASTFIGSASATRRVSCRAWGPSLEQGDGGQWPRGPPTRALQVRRGGRRVGCAWPDERCRARLLRPRHHRAAPHRERGQQATRDRRAMDAALRADDCEAPAAHGPLPRARQQLRRLPARRRRDDSAGVGALVCAKGACLRCRSRRRRMPTPRRTSLDKPICGTTAFTTIAAVGDRRPRVRVQERRRGLLLVQAASAFATHTSPATPTAWPSLSLRTRSKASTRTRPAGAERRAHHHHREHARGDAVVEAVEPRVNTLITV